MHLTTIVLPLLLTKPGLSTAFVSNMQLGTWSLSESHIICDDDSGCRYSFDIYESEHDSISYCDFVVNATDSFTPSRTPFQDIKCGSNSEYSVNGGFMSSGIVLCFKNTDEITWNFFGYDNNEFAYGPPKQSPAYPIGEFNSDSKKRAFTPRGIAPRDKSAPLCCPRTPLSIMWGQRDVNDTGLHIDVVMLDGRTTRFTVWST
ncbi:hypothetical protein BJ170DRAFT_297826 [Xylariales sp. AK1849]|nr:hypothetical protein BJ170DRAFT_297826 [Xylariales sp. AK1849]